MTTAEPARRSGRTAGAPPGPDDVPARSRAGLAARPLLRYRTVDLLVPVALGVAFGIAFRGYGALYALLQPLTTLYPPAEGLLAGLWFLPALLGGFIVRRPGAALLAEVLAASVEALLGSQWGIGTLVSGVLQAMGVEIALVLVRHRRFTLPVAIAGGVISAAIEVIYERVSYYSEFSAPQTLVLVVLFLISGALLCGALGWGLVRALAATGAIDALPAGREHAEERRF